jgi:TatD DNase family protein
MLISCPTGVHPWYAHLVRGPSRSQTETNEQHYERILVSKNSTEKADLVQHLSTPSHEWLQKLRDNLQKYPTALVGEIGFDRSARLLPVGAEHWHGVRPTEVRCSPDHQPNSILLGNSIVQLACIASKHME